MTDARFYSCPIAEIAGGAAPALFQLHRRVAIDGVGLRDLLERPTAAALEGLETIAAERAAVFAARSKREADRRKAEAKRGRR